MNENSALGTRVGEKDSATPPETKRKVASNDSDSKQSLYQGSDPPQTSSAVVKAADLTGDIQPIETSKKPPDLKSLKKHLVANGYSLEGLKQMGNWQDITTSQQSQLEEFSLFEGLLLKAREWLKENCVEDWNLLKVHDEFKQLWGYSKFKKMIRNHTDYRSRAGSKAGSEARGIFTASAVPSERSRVSAQSESQSLFRTPVNISQQALPTLEDFDENKVENQLQNEAWTKWKDLIAQCETCNYQERCQLLKNHYIYDSLGFIRQLEKYAEEVPLKSFFSNLFAIVEELEEGTEQMLLFVHSCAFFGLELLYPAQKDLVAKTAKQAINFLLQDRLTTQTCGLLRLLFVNSISLDDSTAQGLTSLLCKNEIAWQRFIEFLKGSPFKIRREVADRLPLDGLCFSDAFVKVVKQNQGSAFVKVTENFRKLIIDLCAYSSEAEASTLHNFIDMLSGYSFGFEPLLEKANFRTLVAEIVKVLKTRSPMWVRHMDSLHEKLEMVIKGILERKIVDAVEVKDFLAGEDAVLKEQLTSAALISHGTPEDLLHLLKLFKDLNAESREMNSFAIKTFSNQAQRVLDNIQRSFKRQFHQIQLLCLQFILQNLGQKTTFVNFGIGNGKTLLCTSLAILITTLAQKSVIILGKQEYLPYRDHKKFKELVRECGVDCTHNQFLDRGIAYMDLKQVENLFKGGQKVKQFSKAILLIDEYDWLIFDESKPQALFDRLQKLKVFEKIIGFSGSKLNNDEGECLLEAFETQVSTFPIMKDFNGNLIVQHQDIVQSNVKTWKESVFATATKYAQKVPVIVVAANKDCDALAKLFNGHPCTDLSKLNKCRTLANLQNIVDQQFSSRCKGVTYGIYIINEELGIGTDFPTSLDIEAQGGIYIMLVDIFGSRATKQYQGRIGRMQNKGQLQNIVLSKSALLHNNYIHMQQSIIDDTRAKNIEQLLALLKNQTSAKQKVCDSTDATLMPIFFVEDQTDAMHEYSQLDGQHHQKQNEGSEAEKDVTEAVSPNANIEGQEDFQISSDECQVKETGKVIEASNEFQPLTKDNLDALTVFSQEVDAPKLTSRQLMIKLNALAKEREKDEDSSKEVSSVLSKRRAETDSAELEQQVKNDESETTQQDPQVSNENEKSGFDDN